MNIALLVFGIAVVPTTLASREGIISLFAAIAIQIAVALFITIGPFGIRSQEKKTLGTVMPYGLAFGLVYVGILLIEYTTPVASDFSAFGYFIVSFLLLLSFLVGFITFRK